MSDQLPVHINREELYSLELPPSFETSESFDIRLVNHGESTHVHLHLDDALSQLAAIEAPNHHVGRDSERRVRLTLTDDGATRGNLKVVTAYGATTRYVDITVTEPAETTEPVEVGEDLMRPKPRPEPTPSSRLADLPDVALVATSGVTLALAALTAAVFRETLITVVAGVVAVGVLVAVAQSVRN